MSRHGSGDWWLLALVAVIFVVGVGLYIGWDEVGAHFRSVMRFLRSIF